MTVFQREYCQNLCLQEKQDGCCFLNNEHGCYWKGGDYVSDMAGDDAIAVRCSSPGQSLYIYALNVDFINSMSMIQKSV